MPLLVALDECNCALTYIEEYARLGLQHPEIREASLMLILSKFYELDETISGITLQKQATDVGCGNSWSSVVR